jgi:hypothetical protein
VEVQYTHLVLLGRRYPTRDANEVILRLGRVGELGTSVGRVAVVLVPGQWQQVGSDLHESKKTKKATVSHGLLLDLSYVKLNEENVFILPKTR